MQYRRLGATSLRVSAVGLGTNSFGTRAQPKVAEEILVRAVHAGINLIDTANVYTGGRSETIIGQALAGPLKARRDELVIATKASRPVGDGPNDKGASRYHLMREIEGSLRRLQTDHIDLYQIHSFDPDTPLEDTLLTLDALVRSGKVRYVGASNHRAWETMKALGVSEQNHWVRYRSLQVSFSLADRLPEWEILPLCEDQGLGLIAYYPLAGGILTGKYQGGNIPKGSRADVEERFTRFVQPQYVDLAAAVSRVADDLGATPSQVALAWILSRPQTASAIAGASRPEQVEENAKAADLVLPETALEALGRASELFAWGPPFADYRL